MMPHDVQVRPPVPKASDKEENEVEQGPTSNPDQTAIDITKSFYRRGDALLKSIRVHLWRQGY
jgi:hypothetical protein